MKKRIHVILYVLAVFVVFGVAGALTPEHVTPAPIHWAMLTGAAFLGGLGRVCELAWGQQ